MREEGENMRECEGTREGEGGGGEATKRRR